MPIVKITRKYGRYKRGAIYKVDQTEYSLLKDEGVIETDDMPGSQHLNKYSRTQVRNMVRDGTITDVHGIGTQTKQKLEEFFNV